MWETKISTRNYNSDGQSSERFSSAKLSCKQGNVETLYRNGNSPEQIAGFTVIIIIIRCLNV